MVAHGDLVQDHIHLTTCDVNNCWGILVVFAPNVFGYLLVVHFVLNSPIAA